MNVEFDKYICFIELRNFKLNIFQKFWSNTQHRYTITDRKIGFS